jgi:hypothetical protein
MVAGFISERWPASNRNPGRLHIGTPGRIKSESATADPGCTQTGFVIWLVMAWSPARGSNAGCSRLITPETTPLSFPTNSRTAPRPRAPASGCQADDGTLRKLADRIQARAVRRCGELLKQLDGRQGPNLPGAKSGGAPTFSPLRREAAEQAGLSKDQQVTAVRVANVPAEQLEKAVESDKPPTAGQAADRRCLDQGHRQPGGPLAR